MRQDSASFRDPAGFVFYEEGEVYRAVNKSYGEEFALAQSCGLFDDLHRLGYLVTHEVVDLPSYKFSEDVQCILKMEMIPFISYSYEWSFSMLKDAALLVLEINTIALNHGMVLKDASSFNVQFLKGRPIWIDTLSFDRYHDGRPWVAYGQFCRHFLAPLALMAHKDIFLGKLTASFVDGIPLSTAAKVLSGTRHLGLGIALHLKKHASLEASSNDKMTSGKPATLNRFALRALVDHLGSTIAKLRISRKVHSFWADYYQTLSYTPVGDKEKQGKVRELLTRRRFDWVVDIGANDGRYSRIAAENSGNVLSLDFDPLSVERNYLELKELGIKNILPLIVDIANPSPAIGWNNIERPSVFARIRDKDALVLALAVVHHLRITCGVPFELMLRCFRELAASIIVEWVPRNDPMVEEMLIGRSDIFTDLDTEQFRDLLSSTFGSSSEFVLPGSLRLFRWLLVDE